MRKQTALKSILRLAAAVVPVLAALLAGSARPVQADPVTWYVDLAAAGTQTGLDWTNALTDLRAAIESAAPGDQIWIADGTYRPSKTGDRSASFVLKPNVPLYGGFAGGEAELDDRSIYSHVAILSGDLELDDYLGPDHRDDNSYHVVTAVSLASLDGVRVSGGYADGGGEHNNGAGVYISAAAVFTMANVQIIENEALGSGGGIYSLQSSPTLNSVLLGTNTAGADGGGMYVELGSPVLYSVGFTGNSAGAFGGGMYNDRSTLTMEYVALRANAANYGGGIYNVSSSPALAYLLLDGNTAVYDGGGMFNQNSSPTLSYATFTGNSAQNGGGFINVGGSPLLDKAFFSANTADNGAGMKSLFGSPALVNVTFSANVATLGGGALHISGGSLSLEHATLHANRAATGGGIFSDAAGPVTLRSSIIWGSSGGQIVVSSGAFFAGDSIVQGGWPGAGNLDLDPLLAPAASYAGLIDFIALLPGSPALNATTDGCVARDGRGVFRAATPCDIGAFESPGFVLEVIGGDGQQTPANRPFNAALAVRVRAYLSTDPVNGGRVVFSAPASGPGAALSSSATTITDGLAVVEAAANLVGGAYVVTAAAAGATPVSFSLLNQHTQYLSLTAAP